MVGEKNSTRMTVKELDGKILVVDLEKSNCTEEVLDTSTRRKFIGGYGLGAFYVYTHTSAGIDPLGPDNILGFCPGLFTGTPAPMSGRTMVCGKSPLTGGWNDSNVGGYIGEGIKRSGFDAIFFHGKSRDKVYLHVGEDGKAELLDASALWGLDIAETTRMLKEKHGSRTRAAMIGPAGENSCLFAGIATMTGRFAGRGGMGAVMGSKNLKAVCFSARKPVPMADKEAVVSIARAYSSIIKGNDANIAARLATKLGTRLGPLLRVFKLPIHQNQVMATRVFKNWGTAFATNIQVDVGDAPAKNFAGIGYKEFPDKISRNFTTGAMEKWITRHQGCFACPVQCGHVMDVPELGLKNVTRPEYEILAAFGPLLLNEDVKEVIKINDYLYKVGLDGISAGVVVSFVMECCEKGLLKREDFKCEAYPNGFIPDFGKTETIMPILEMIVKREGLGDVLANGTRNAAKSLGDDHAALAMSINGQEVPMHDPRLSLGLLASYISDPTPGRHTAASLQYFSLGEVNSFIDGLKFDLTKKLPTAAREHARFARILQVTYSAGLCKFATWFARYPLLETFKAVAGWDMDLKEIETTGWRIQVLRQMFNAREHAIRMEVPPRLLGIPPMEDGPLKGVTHDPRDFILEYFASMGFNEDGVPLEDTLDKLGLDFCKDDLSKAKGCPVPQFSKTS